MSDQDNIVRLLAEKVMGFELLPHPFVADRCVRRVCGCTFAPLDDDRDACQVLDKMAEDGFRVEVSRDGSDDEWGVSYEKGRSFSEVIDKDRRRCICLAALAAKGVTTQEVGS